MHNGISTPPQVTIKLTVPRFHHTVLNFCLEYSYTANYQYACKQSSFACIQLHRFL